MTITLSPTTYNDLLQQENGESATLAMQVAARRILQCPYRGMTKRLYLEGKALELLALVIAQEREIGDGTPSTQTLKPVLKSDTIERIYHARDILRQRLDNPPSLMELARQVGLNECTLKQGFRQVFNTTAFSDLYEYSMQQALQLLETGDFKVEEVAKRVGYQNRSAFAVAFRRKFGVNPSEYRRSHRRKKNSVVSL